MIIKKQKLTSRERRMHHFKQVQAGAGINLVSMMDIFTILVFFLLVHTGTQQLPNSKDLKLPVTLATKVPDENLVLTVTKDSILVQGKQVARVQEAMASPEAIIAPLSAELKLWASARATPTDAGDGTRAVLILSDETIPFALLGKILSTCGEAKYSQILFAAQHVGKAKSEL